MFEYPIAIGLSPNTEGEDYMWALKMLFYPWKWKEGKEIGKVENWFRKYFNAEFIYTFNSGRSALIALLQAFNIGEGDEVLMQAFTCVAVPDPVIWIGAKPVFVDIDDTLNINPLLIEKSITEKTKAIIVQHTFGIPADIMMIKKIAQKHNLILIEDCAHALGAKMAGKRLGTFGDAAFFSFGRDKVISSVFGGMALINQKSKIKNQKLMEYHSSLKYPSYFWIFQQLFHPIAFSIILPLYNLSIGKFLLWILLSLNLLSKPVLDEEKRGEKPAIFPGKYPNALASLLLSQMKKIDKYNLTRQKIASFYFRKLSLIPDINLPVKDNGAIYMRFNIMTQRAGRILANAKKRGVILGNWYKKVIDPAGVEYIKVNYTKGSCPEAEKAAMLSVNLPTYPRLQNNDLEKIISLLKEQE